ncbi:transporter substrate-binding domain-containing protein [Clostridium estertheticum]|uniref:Transporter substrate-binding domain-containing protein n=1 Tax=Clostridium estertheticum TaxID=238834 RepID=A0AA47I8M6_9CLOT|nr:transporter substrate-binding domain-containing protein [Clostridium estertheticum]MBU3154531.1 transporter substrate-binding domain-containing protein [Clostridium estertheticum]MBU3201255.1 transporter substrate-binding domain-containing protein [Clostridium estertheticum]WAG62035.1 transporter substrate-binding domain-containing protein [Clostridium estertheticum]WAG63841.1 transporter substrate-binding domain-containing protein [Clostridium estertheticum]
MKKSKLSKLLTEVIAFSLVFSLAGCSSKTSNVSASKTEPKTIIIGIGNAFKPYCYLDDKGQIAGYEHEVLQEVNKLLPQYKFEYQPAEFKTILVSLGAKKVDLAAHQYEKNPEREAKYLFGEESYTTFILRITDKKGRTDIKGIADLKGKTVQTSPGSNDAYILGEYNKKNNNAIKLVYSSADQATTVKSVEDGRIDAFISIKRVVDSLNKTYGDVIQTVGDPIASSSTYYVYRKEDTKLKSDVDGALKTLKSNGKLSKISIKILGGDYTTND